MWFPCVMDYAALILAILFVDLLALVSPGPNFILVSSTAVSAPRRAAIWTGTGIATGSLIWASGSCCPKGSSRDRQIGSKRRLPGAAFCAVF